MRMQKSKTTFIPHHMRLETYMRTTCSDVNGLSYINLAVYVDYGIHIKNSNILLDMMRKLHEESWA